MFPLTSRKQSEHQGAGTKKKEVGEKSSLGHQRSSDNSEPIFKIS